MINLKEIRKKKNMTLEQLSSKIGMSRGNLSQIERGLIGVSQDNLSRLAIALGCNVSQLIGESSLNNETICDIRYYEELGHINNCEARRVSVGDSFLKILKIKDFRNIIISKINEKNMEPTISNGDLVIIDSSLKEIKNNKIYLIREMDNLKIKRIRQLSPFDSDVTILSDNQIDGEYPPYKIDINIARNNILGQVLFFGHSAL